MTGVAPIAIWLPCRPPKTTAQTKRMAIVDGRPRFYHSLQLQSEQLHWVHLLRPFRPSRPLTGALALEVTFIYPHLAKTRKADLDRLLPKVSKPDAGNAAKHLEDTLVRMRFMEDDQQIARLTVEKWHGPAERVGIGITLRTMETPV